jgi:hypothetical protein
MNRRLTIPIALSILVAAVVFGPTVGSPQAGRAVPVVIIHTGRVFTGAGRPAAEALAGRGNRILTARSFIDVPRRLHRNSLLVSFADSSRRPGRMPWS